MAPQEETYKVCEIIRRFPAAHGFPLLPMVPPVFPTVSLMLSRPLDHFEINALRLQLLVCRPDTSSLKTQSSGVDSNSTRLHGR